MALCLVAITCGYMINSFKMLEACNFIISHQRKLEKKKHVNGLQYPYFLPLMSELKFKLFEH